MKTQTPTSVDQYIKAQPDEVKKYLIQIRKTILTVAPHVKESIKYGIPTFEFYGNLLHFASWKSHIGFYATPSGNEAFAKELKPYVVSKGAIQFPYDQPLPVKLISRIAIFRIQENLYNAKVKKLKVKPEITYHKDGTIWAIGKMKNGRQEGKWEWFRKDGSMLRARSFKDGKQVGKWTTYDKMGEAYKETIFK
jgi:uncharacterized protein YdhG (YjbR/CyaY superfamily)